MNQFSTLWGASTLKRTTLALLFLGTAYSIQAQTAHTWAGATGANWGTANNWSPATVPGASDPVTINSSNGALVVNIDVAAVCASLTLNVANKALTVQITGSNSLTVGTGGTGAVTFTGGTGNNLVYKLDVAAGTLNCGNVTFVAGNGASGKVTLNIGTGTATIKGNINGSLAGAGVVMTGGSLNITGDLASGNTATSFTGGTVNFNGSGAQVVGAYTYNNLSTSTGGTKSLSGVTTIGGTLTIGTSSTFSPSGNNLTVTGPTTVNGALSIVSATGTKTFNGDVTISSTGTWSETAASPVTFAGSLRNNNTTNNSFTASTGIHTFSGSGKFLSGTLSVPNVDVTGFYTNDATLTVSTALTGTNGTLKQGSGVNLTIGGTIAVTNLDATTNPTNTVTYTSSNAQTIGNYAYSNLTLSGTGAKTLPSAALTVNKDLSMSGGGVTANGNLTVGGNFDLLNGTLNAGTFTHTVTGNLTNSTGIAPGTSTFIFNTPVFQTVGAGNFYNVTFSGAGNRVATGNIAVSHDLTISPGATFSASPSPNTYSHSVGHDWVNNGLFDAGIGTITFNGAAAQTISGSAPTSFYSFTINNAAGVTLSRAATIQNLLTFSAGNITSSSTNLLVFNDNATVAGASDASYVNGPVEKIGNDAFVFPVGKPAGGTGTTSAIGYNPISISPPSNLDVTDAFTAEYFNVNPTTNSTITAPGLAAVSVCQYWTLNRTVGLSTVNVGLSWKANSKCNSSTYISDPSTLVVAHKNGTNWDAYGRNSFTGNGTAGSVTWDNVSTFSPFTIGTTDATLNPLPVTFVSFTGRKTDGGTQLTWSVAGESTVKGYEVERRTGNGQFTKIGFVAATGNSSYTFTDPTQQKGVVFYRLKNVDEDGQFSYSTILSFRNGTGISVFPTLITNKVTILHDAAAATARISLSTADGKQVKLQRPQPGATQTVVDMAGIQAGMYLLEWSDGTGYTETVKLIKQ